MSSFMSSVFRVGSRRVSVFSIVAIFLVFISSCNDQQGYTQDLKRLPEPDGVFKLSPTARCYRHAPDGRHVCYWDLSERGFKGEHFSDYALYLSDPSGKDKANLSEPIVVSSIDRTCRSTPDWSADSDHIAFTWMSGPDRSRSNVIVVSCRTRGIKKILPEEEEQDVELSNASWSPDGTRLAFVQQGPAKTDAGTVQASLMVCKPDGAVSSKFAIDIVKSGEGSFDCMTSIGWSPDGRRIAVAAGNGLFVADIEEDKLAKLRSPPGPSGYWWPKTTVRWSPDGSRIAFCSKWRLYIFHLGSKEMKAVKVNSTNHLHDLAWIGGTDHLLLGATYEKPLLGDLPETIARIGENPRHYRHVPFVVSAATGEHVELSDLAVENYDGSYNIEGIPEVAHAFSIWSR